MLDKWGSKKGPLKSHRNSAWRRSQFFNLNNGRQKTEDNGLVPSKKRKQFQLRFILWVKISFKEWRQNEDIFRQQKLTEFINRYMEANKKRVFFRKEKNDLGWQLGYARGNEEQWAGSGCGIARWTLHKLRKVNNNNLIKSFNYTEKNFMKMVTFNMGCWQVVQVSQGWCSDREVPWNTNWSILLLLFLFTSIPPQ